MSIRTQTRQKMENENTNKPKRGGHCRALPGGEPESGAHGACSARASVSLQGVAEGVIIGAHRCTRWEARTNVLPGSL